MESINTIKYKRPIKYGKISLISRHIKGVCPIFTGLKKQLELTDPLINDILPVDNELIKFKKALDWSAINKVYKESASAVGCYGSSDETELSEESPPGNDFLAQVCTQWEKEALRAEDFGVRTVVLRTGIVLDRGGGALEKMIPPFKYYIGGPIGNGKQYFSWI